MTLSIALGAFPLNGCLTASYGIRYNPFYIVFVADFVVRPLSPAILWGTLGLIAIFDMHSTVQSGWPHCSTVDNEMVILAPAVILSVNG